MNKKNNLRRFAKDLRKNYDFREERAKILQIFSSSSLYLQKENIAAFYPYGTEIDIKPLFKDGSKKWYLPRVTSEMRLTFHPYNDGDELEVNEYGIFEPKTQAVPPAIIDLIIVPALSCDRRGYRVGYGKGYYDRFFSQSGFQGTKVVFLPDKFCVDKIENDKWDVPVDVVFTEFGEFFCP